MCKYRRVRNYYTLCGHGITLPDEEIQCEQSNCKFSSAHPPVCPRCTRTCKQYRDYPEQYSPHIQAMCPKCA